MFGTNSPMDQHMRRLLAEMELDQRKTQERRAAAAERKAPAPEVYLPDPPASGICAIHWLAPETLDYVLSLVADAERADMRETCLVARPWRLPSQAQLWKELFFLPMDDMLEDLLESASCGQFGTAAVSFQGGLGTRAPNRSPLIAQLVPQLHGLKKMQIAEHEQLNANLFLSPSLARLEDLSINHCSFQPLPSRLSLPFHLTRLELTGDSSFPPRLLSSLLLASTPSLLTLALNLSSHLSAFKTLLTFFPSLAASLTRLELSAPYPTLSPLLSHCTALTTLRLASTVPDTPWDPSGFSFAGLGPTVPLRTLEIVIFGLEEKEERRTAANQVDAVCWALECGESMLGLERVVLVLDGEGTTSVEVVKGLEDFREVCRERGVEVVVQDEREEYF